MKRKPMRFLFAGLLGGVIWATIGSLEPTVLTIGVGLCFFLAVVTAIALTGAQSHLRVGMSRYLACAVLSSVTYVCALLAFNIAVGLTQQLGIRASGDLLDFRVDVWLGLIAAAAVGASGIALFTATLTRKWSSVLLRRLMLAGLLTIVVTFLANLPFHNYWSFFGVLLPLGNALFCYFVGARIWQDSEVATWAGARAPTA
jgi:hypothetical protein